MLEINNLSYRYPNSCTFALSNINLHINKGEVIVLCGKSGSGKSTLLQTINGIIPLFKEGELTGDIYISNQNTKNLNFYDFTKLTGTVFQNPKTQFFNVDSDSELVFTLANLGYSKQYIFSQRDKILNQFKAKHLLNQNLFHLSGGQKQLVSALSIAIHQPPIILLDEPSSNLDVQTIDKLKQMINYWKTIGTTVIVAEHRLYYLMQNADRFVYMDNGRVLQEYTQQSFISLDTKSYQTLNLRQRSTPQLRPIKKRSNNSNGFITGNYTFNTKDFSLNVPKLHLISPAIYGVIGPNGAGKSTWIKHLIGLVNLKKAQFTIDGQQYKRRKCIKMSTLVMQDVNHQLFTESVSQEMSLSMKRFNLEKLNQYLDIVNLNNYKNRHPMSLSGGEKQRLAIATSLASNKQVFIFDEPTSGLDLENMLRVAQMLIDLREQGKQVFLITHDIELLNACADEIISLENGSLKGIYTLDNNFTNLK